MTLKNIVWLASYPKSGNTWTRAFLANYLFNSQEPIPINQIHRLGMGDSVTKSYQMVAGGPIEPRDHMAMLELRPKVMRGIANNRAEINFVKSHNINDTALGHILIPAELTRNAIYILRNPVDMIVSYARHYGHTIDSAIEGVGRMDNTTAGGDKNVKQFLGSWSAHVLSWADCKLFPVHTMRYEDMLAKPEDSFGELLDVIGIPVDDERLARAVKNSSFNELSKQEEKTEFIERSDNNSKFFHTGTSEQWKSEMTQAQIDQVIAAHETVMKRFGYI